MSVPLDQDQQTDRGPHITVSCRRFDGWVPARALRLLLLLPLAWVIAIATLLDVAPALSSTPIFGQESVRPIASIRLRQELLRNVFYTSAQHDDRNWIRLRTRAGLKGELSAEHRFEFRTAHEFRKIFDPSGIGIDWDEIVIDRLTWTWTPHNILPLTLTLGRQDIIWNQGFLVLEGHPLDGSRTIYQNAVRFQLDYEENSYELVAIANPQHDPWVLGGDEYRPLNPGDERALALRFIKRDGYQVAAIWKKEKDLIPTRDDRTSWTFSLRVEQPGSSCTAAQTPWVPDSSLHTASGRSGASCTSIRSSRKTVSQTGRIRQRRTSS